MPSIESYYKTIVLIAQSLNPAIFSESWFIKNKILEAEEFTPSTDSIITAQFAQIFTSHFDILVLPDQIQFTLKVDESKSIQKIIDTIQKSQIEFKLLGINFNYFIEGADTKALFYNTSNSTYKSFNEPNCKFGAYLSKDSIFTSRLKLDIKPVTRSDSNKELLHYAFNYHINLNTNPTITSILDNWSEFDKDASDIILATIK